MPLQIYHARLKVPTMVGLAVNDRRLLDTGGCVERR
jgi:hypothetical protein